MRVGFVCLFSCCLATHAFGQNQPALGSWNIQHVRCRIYRKVDVFTEWQLRSLRFFDDFHYWEWTAGAIWRPHPQVVATLASGKYVTYQEGGDFVAPARNNEVRWWPQIAFKQEVGRVRVEHRYRSEQRYTSNGFRFRFRTQLKLTVPFNDSTIRKGVVGASLSNELFYTTRAPYFERNRFIALVFYRATEAVQLHIGYVRQFDYQINDETGRSFLQVAAQYDIR